MTDKPAFRITDGLGHDLPASTDFWLASMLEWLGLEEAAGELSPGLSDLRDALREQADEVST